MSGSQLISELFNDCSLLDSSRICDYSGSRTGSDNVTVTNGLADRPAGPKLYTAMLLLALALIFKMLLTVATFGMKVTNSSLSSVLRVNCLTSIY